MSRANRLAGLITPKLVSVGGTSVGINSTSPTTALDVFGTIRATSFIKSDGTPIGGGGVGIQSGGGVVGSGITALNFIGVGHTFKVTGDTVDISIEGGVGIQSGGEVVGSDITALNFIGVGNTFKVTGTTMDISIEGGGSSGALVVDGGDYNSASSLAGAGTSINGGEFN